MKNKFVRHQPEQKDGPINMETRMATIGALALWLLTFSFGVAALAQTSERTNSLTNGNGSAEKTFPGHDHSHFRDGCSRNDSAPVASPGDYDTALLASL